MILKSVLARRLMLWVIPVALSGIGVIGTFAYITARKHILDNVALEIKTLGYHTAVVVGAFFQQRADDLDTIAESPLFIDHYNNRRFGLTQEAEIYRRELESYLLEFSKRVRVYDHILYIDEMGREVCKIEKSRINRNRDQFMKRELLDRIARISGNGHYKTFLKSMQAMRYIKPLYDKNGKLVGGLLLDCNLSRIQKILEGVTLGISGWAYLMNDNGEVLAGIYPNPKLKPSKILTTESEIEGTGWKVAIGAQESDFLKPLSQIENLTISLAFVCGLLVSILIYLRIRTLTRPVQDLVGAARNLEAGQLGSRVAIQSDDEIGVLSKAFNRMAESLSERTSALQTRIEENKILLQTLAESESRYRSVLENSPIAILGLTKEHRIFTWNRGAELIFGFTSDFILGKPIQILFPEDQGESFKSLLAEVMLVGSVRDFALSGITKDGRRLDLHLSWGGSFQDFWMNKEWTIVIRDVTEAKKLEAQIIRSEKLSAVGQLLSSIAHELNNPLQAVIGYSQLLAKAGKKGREDVDMIVENSLRCRKIIDNLLLFVRHGEVEKGPVRVQKAVSAALSLLQYKLSKSASVNVTVDIPAELPLVQANLQQIQQVLVNLINNACDAMAGQIEEKKIGIKAFKNQDKVRIELSDSGPGIPKDIQERIFEPFYTTKPEGRGTGLGLSVCRQIVQEHGGAIGLGSAEGFGTTFVIDLPLAKGKEQLALPAKLQTPHLQGKSILIIDDEPDILSYLAKVIELEGHRADKTLSLERVKKKVLKKPYDLIISDVRLGEGTGIDLYERWSEWSKNPRPPFLFITGDVLDSSLENMVEEKSLTLLHKPVDMETFIGAMRSLLSGNLPEIAAGRPFEQP